VERGPKAIVPGRPVGRLTCKRDAVSQSIALKSNVNGLVVCKGVSCTLRFMVSIVPLRQTASDPSAPKVELAGCGNRSLREFRQPVDRIPTNEPSALKW
jgi:hypothetical protein